MLMFRVVGGSPLAGEIEIGCAKNAVLPILAAVLLTEAPVTIKRCPALKDVENMISILVTLGCKAEREGTDVRLDASKVVRHEMPEHLSKRLRSSIFMMGPLLGRFRRARVTYPGGCDIGQRPIDLHLRGLSALGVVIREKNGMIYLDGSKLRGADVYLDFPSVGATENVMMAAVLAKGVTNIHNAAREPEIRDLQNFLNAMNADVSGAGGDTITIRGVDQLGGCSYTPLPDRIVAGTMLAATCATRGEVTLKNACAGDMLAVLDKLRQMGCKIDTTENEISVSARAQLTAVRLSTQPFPGFPTDLQAQFMALACTLKGVSVIIENVFESRFQHVPQLMRMGADIFVNGRIGVVHGGALTGAHVETMDLRGGAALVIAALAAEGESLVYNAQLIDRGYESLETMLSALGGNIERVTGS